MADVAKHDTKRSETQLIGEVRIAHPFHQEKRTKSAGGALLEKPRNDAVLLVPKLNPDPTQCANYAKLAGMCMEAATKAWGSWPQGGKWPIQNGDVPHEQKPKPGITPLTPEQIIARNAWRTGCWVVEVATNLDHGPKVAVMQNGVATEIPAKSINGVQLYKSGDYGFVSMSAYTFHNKTFGVNFGYEGVLYTRPGELIGNGPRSASQMFAGVAGTAASAAPVTPGAAAPPPAAPPAAAPQAYAPPPVAHAAPPAPPAPPAAPVAAAAPPIAPGMPPMPPAPVGAALPGMPPLPGVR